MKSKIFLVFLGVAMTLSACSNISNRPEPTQTAATDSSKPEKTSSASSLPTGAHNQTLRQDKSEAKTTGAKAQAHRENYKPFSLSKLAKADTLIGDDPKAIALSAFGDVESEGGSREVKVDYPQSDQAVVTITQTGVADDSVREIRYRAELATTSKSAQTSKQWKLVWAGSQVKCQPGRGSQDWTTELCL